MRIKTLRLFILTLILNGCATEQKYRTRINQWLGSSSIELIRAWGEPNKVVYLENGSKILHYAIVDTGSAPVGPLEARKVPSEQFGIPLLFGAKIPIGHMPDMQTMESPYPYKNFSFICNTIFEVDSKNIVARTGVYGDNCKSR